MLKQYTCVVCVCCKIILLYFIFVKPILFEIATLSGSYRQTFLNNKIKRQSSDGSVHPFAAYNSNKDDEGKFK